MGALFYSYGSNGMFKNSVGPGSAPAQIDMFSDLVRKDSLCIITQVGIQISDVVQFFLTFDDFVHYYYFGKGVGNITISGMIFLNCDNQLPGVSDLLEGVGQKRGQEIKVSMNDHWFIGVLIDCSIQMVSEPETMVTFQANLGMIDHSLPSPQPKQPKC